MDTLPSPSTAVSYTHLDVYKRQVVYRENGRACHRYPESPYRGAGCPGKREHCPGTGGKAAMNKTRPKQLSFRVSEEEYQQLQQKISESGKNQQEYILSCVLEKQIVNTDGIKELIPELKRIGNLSLIHI